MGEVMKERFHFLSRDGKTKINAVKWIPKSGSVRAVMQMTHGMIEYIERYDEFACYLAGRGFWLSVMTIWDTGIRLRMKRNGDIFQRKGRQKRQLRICIR